MSDNFVTDPTHRMPFTPRSFDYYDSTRPLGTLGRIYGFGPSLRVLTAERIYGDRYGDDVYHRLLVVKPPAPVLVPARLPSHLHNGEPRFVSRARAAATRYPLGRAIWWAARCARGSWFAARCPGA
jgi:hypothetical protein